MSDNLTSVLALAALMAADSDAPTRRRRHPRKPEGATAEPPKKDDQLTLGQICANRKNLSPEQREKDYFLLQQTRNNEARYKTYSTMVQNDRYFLTACEIAKVKPTRRQAAKWKRRVGAAFAVRYDARTRMDTPTA